MIPIVRTAEPVALTTERAKRLPVARLAAPGDRAALLAGYAVAKDALAEMQRLKCAYCEKPEEQAKYREVEHYRPKAEYWWLTWTWENLLFACADCNREHKRDQFPHDLCSISLVAEAAPPGGELPLLLDPSNPQDDPLDNIRFERRVVGRTERWVPVGLTARGRETVRVCGLDRAGLLDLYRAHVVDAVRPRVDEVRGEMERGNAQAIARRWGGTTRRLLARERPYRALSHDALDILVPKRLRDQYRLELPRPA